MRAFDIAAREVNSFLRRNQIEGTDILSTNWEKGSDKSLRVTWKKAGRMQGEILILSAATAHFVLAILSGQSAEPLVKFGEENMRPAERGTHYDSRPVSMAANL